MRLRYYLVPSLLLVSVATGGAVTAHAAGDRQRTFADGAAALRAEWSSDQARGVPATSLAPLRAQLVAQSPTASWWSPSWFSDDGHALLATLEGRTQSVWKAALANSSTQAQAVIAQWSTFADQQGAWLTSDVTAAAGRWSSELAAAKTPGEIDELVSTWRAFVAGQRTAVTAAQQAKLEQLQQELQSAGGPQAVLATAQRLVDTANADNLDAGDVASLSAQLTNAVADNGDTEQIASQLLVAVNALQSLVNLNNQVAGQIQPLLWTVDQAQAEGTPNAAALAATNAGIPGAFRAARTADQMSGVEQTLTTLTAQVNAELSANQCGHNVGSGKVITVSLALQEMVFYQDGCVVKATPVSTGRPQLRTPTGTFHIFNKQTPFQFISPWPPSSPYYYYPSWVSWVMEFAGGGYFIHDAPWEASDAYGPGSEDNPAAASHGCIHVPTPVMQWAYTWTDNGTPVVIS